MKATVVAAIVAIPLVAVAVAQRSPQTSAGIERLEGDWVRVDPNASGAFDGLTSKFTPASLTAQGATDAEAMRQRQNAPRGPAYTESKPHNPGDPYIVVSRPCGGGAFGGGELGINPDSGAVHLVVSKDEIIVGPERGGIRHIYLDGRKHPELSRWTPTGSGHSVGRFENGELIVDTVGITPGGVVASGYRTPETRLTERFVVSPDSSHLTIEYRWEDPKIYQTPHVYRYELDRLPAGSYAFEQWCDASDPAEQESVTPPPQP